MTYNPAKDAYEARFSQGQNPVQALDRGEWADTNPNKCLCNGFGWVLSAYDTYHRCPVHGSDVDGVDIPHPEAYTDDFTGEIWFDEPAHRLAMLKDAFKVYRGQTTLFNKKEFLFACRLQAKDIEGDVSPSMWTNIAEDVLMRFLSVKGSAGKMLDWLSEVRQEIREAQ